MALRGSELIHENRNLFVPLSNFSVFADPYDSRTLAGSRAASGIGLYKRLLMGQVG